MQPQRCHRAALSTTKLRSLGCINGLSLIKPRDCAAFNLRFSLSWQFGNLFSSWISEFTDLKEKE